MVLQQLDTTLDCQTCGQETRHQILYLGQRIAEVRCVDCGRCIGMDRDEVVRAFIGEVVIQILRLPYEVRRELRAEGLGKMVATLPGRVARLPRAVAQDAIHLLRVVWSLRGDRKALEAVFDQVETVLFCRTCNRDTPHRILYLGRRLAEARCETCGRGVGMTREEVFSDFVGEVFLHLMKLPRHVRQELRSDFAHAVQTLPREMVRMPFRLARDVTRLIRMIRAPRKLSGAPEAPASSRPR